MVSVQQIESWQPGTNHNYYWHSLTSLHRGLLTDISWLQPTSYLLGPKNDSDSTTPWITPVNTHTAYNNPIQYIKQGTYFEPSWSSAVMATVKLWKPWIKRQSLRPLHFILRPVLQQHLQSSPSSIHLLILYPVNTYSMQLTILHTGTLTEHASCPHSQ